MPAPRTCSRAGALMTCVRWSRLRLGPPVQSEPSGRGPLVCGRCSVSCACLRPGPCFRTMALAQGGAHSFSGRSDLGAHRTVDLAPDRGMAFRVRLCRSGPADPHPHCAGHHPFPLPSVQHRLLRTPWRPARRPLSEDTEAPRTCSRPGRRVSRRMARAQDAPGPARPE
jgi:hypothetical protein